MRKGRLATLGGAARSGTDKKLIVSAACQCARRALQYVPAREGSPLKAIETAEAWVEGRSTIDDVRAAADAANAAYTANAAEIKAMCDIVRSTIPCPEVN